MKMDNVELYKEYRLIEKDDEEINGAWKGAHLLFFFLAFVFGSFCTFCFHMLMYLFDEKCVLFPKLLSLKDVRHNVIYDYIPPQEKNSDNMPVDFVTTQWVDKSACYLPMYVPLVSGICGLVWTTMFFMFSSGSRTLGLQRPWRLLPFIFIFSCAMSTLCIYTSMVTTTGLMELCDKLSEVTGSEVCSYTINVVTLAYDRRIRGVYQATQLTIFSAWLHTSCWILAALLALARVILVIDFRLVLISTTLRGNLERMLERIETHLQTVTPEYATSTKDNHTNKSDVSDTIPPIPSLMPDKKWNEYMFIAKKLLYDLIDTITSSTDGSSERIESASSSEIAAVSYSGRRELQKHNELKQLYTEAQVEKRPSKISLRLSPITPKMKRKIKRRQSRLKKIKSIKKDKTTQTSGTFPSDEIKRHSKILPSNVSEATLRPESDDQNDQSRENETQSLQTITKDKLEQDTKKQVTETQSNSFWSQYIRRHLNKFILESDENFLPVTREQYQPATSSKTYKLTTKDKLDKATKDASSSSLKELVEHVLKINSLIDTISEPLSPITPQDKAGPSTQHTDESSDHENPVADESEISEKDISEKDTSEKDTSEKDTSEKDTSEKDTSDKDSSEKDTSQKDASEKDTSENKNK